ncbi:MAG: hypothetical protein RSC04_02705 [Bacteroidales bacterium]
MRFRDIIGQRELINKIIHAVAQGRIAHAQLFLGGEGRQKLPLALAYAQYINCTHKVSKQEVDDLGELEADSCGHCPSCIKFTQLQHPDLHFIFPNNTNGRIDDKPKSSDFIGEWRTLCLQRQAEFSLSQWYAAMGIGNKQGTINTRDCGEILDILNYKNYEADFKFIIIWMVEKLYYAAAPKILKVLEEPADKTVFILISENQDQILNTILSRTQLVKFPSLTSIDIENALVNKHFVSTEKAHYIAQKANGNYIEALSKIENGEEDLYFHEMFVKWMRLCYLLDIPKLAEFGNQINKLGRESIKQFLRHSMDKLRLCMLLHYGNEQWIHSEGEELKFISNFSQFIDANNIEQFNQNINNAIYHIERNANGNILMMDLSLRFYKLIKTKSTKK